MSVVTEAFSPLVLVGNPDPVHVGAHLAAGAKELGYRLAEFNSEDAFAANAVVKMLNWHLRGHRPTRLAEFSERVVATCRELQPRWILSTGIAPIDQAGLKKIGELGIRRINFLTDDPWNPAHEAPWFMEALPLYDAVFSPRRANLSDLLAQGCHSVSYLPFAYAPHLHYLEPPQASEADTFAVDVVFAGGADTDRMSSIGALRDAGLSVALYGGYWDRYPGTRRFARGHAGPQTLRRAVAGAKVALCLVRRANRDGNSMRTFEVAAMGACIMAEYTDEHREILGEDGEAVVYFRSTDEMLERLRWLLEHEDERKRLRVAARARITGGRHTYMDRLRTMLEAASGPSHPKSVELAMTPPLVSTGLA